MAAEYTHYWGPLAQTMRPFVDSTIKRFDRLVCDAADVVVTPSRKAADYLAELAITPPVKIIPNGVDLSLFSAHRSDFLRRLLPIGDDQRIILFVGRMNEEKRPLAAYAAFHELAARRDDVCLVMAGSGPLAAQVWKIAKEDGLQARVHLPGVIKYEQMPQVYQSADVWISTSTSEVHPMVALEACACGLPAVVMQDRALEGVIGHGLNGFIVNTPGQFVEQLDQLLGDDALRRRMGKATLQQAKSFDIAVTAARLCAIYKSLVHPSEDRN